MQSISTPQPRIAERHARRAAPLATPALIASALLAFALAPMTGCNRKDKPDKEAPKAGAAPTPADSPQKTPQQTPTAGAATSATPAGQPVVAPSGSTEASRALAQQAQQMPKGAVNQPEEVAPPTTDAELSARLKLPPGFRAEIYTKDVPNARAMVLSERGTLFVGTRKPGVVYAVPDRDGDGAADKVHVVARDLTLPVGLDLHQGALYVSSLDRVVRLDDIEARLTDPPEPVVVSDGFPDDVHHGWKFIRFGPDGKLYVPVGAPCNICSKSDERYASIMRMNPDGSELEVFAHGVRNTVGFDWHPETGEMWFTDNGRDWLGDDAPSDELNRATAAGQHFGYPFCHAGSVADPEFGSQRPCSEFVAPAALTGPHVAGLGVRFYTGNKFPERYRGAIFIAEHGSWNRAEPNGYRVSVVTLGPDGNAASYEIFAQGFLETKGAWGRPVDVLVHPDGSLLVSDDRAGAVYRIVYDGA